MVPKPSSNLVSFNENTDQNIQKIESRLMKSSRNIKVSAQSSYREPLQSLTQNNNNNNNNFAYEASRYQNQEHQFFYQRQNYRPENIPTLLKTPCELCETFSQPM